jgi:hypothetical protein
MNIRDGPLKVMKEFFESNTRRPDRPGNTATDETAVIDF